MKPVFVSHEKYQNFVMEQLQAHYSGSGILVLRNDMWPTVTKLWITDLSEITKQLSDSYGKTGPPPRDPACMLRCYLLLILTNPTMSITQWVNELYKVPLYAILSGFEPNDVPGVGTFYDCFERVWGSDKQNASTECTS